MGKRISSGSAAGAKKKAKGNLKDSEQDPKLAHVKRIVDWFFG